MVNSNDGFEIAEVDLELRGPGDIEGTQQSGFPFDLKIAHIGRDQQVLQYARKLVEEILDKDPLLESDENKILQEQLKRLVSNRQNYSVVS